VVLVDTSIFISLHRHRSARIAQRLQQLANRNEAAVCGPVWVEFVGGFRSKRKRERIAEMLKAYPWLDSPRQVFELAADWVADYRGIGAGDAIIAATAYFNDARLMTIDKGLLTLTAAGLEVELIDA